MDAEWREPQLPQIPMNRAERALEEDYAWIVSLRVWRSLLELVEWPPRGSLVIFCALACIAKRPSWFGEEVSLHPIGLDDGRRYSSGVLRVLLENDSLILLNGLRKRVPRRGSTIALLRRMLGCSL
jgi:hypothetical protein